MHIYIYKSLWYECGIRKDSPSWFPLRRAFLACSSLFPAIAICREIERDGVYITCVVFVSGFPFLSHEREKERGEESKFDTSAISNQAQNAIDFWCMEKLRTFATPVRKLCFLHRPSVTSLLAIPQLPPLHTSQRQLTPIVLTTVTVNHMNSIP